MPRKKEVKRGRGRPRKVEPVKKGRPTKKPAYDSGMLEKIFMYVRTGRTMCEIAEFIGVHRSQLYRWIENDPIFRDNIARGKSAADDIVEASVFKRARGMKIRTQKVFYDKGLREQYISNLIQSAGQLYDRLQPPIVSKSKSQADRAAATDAETTRLADRAVFLQEEYKRISAEADELEIGIVRGTETEYYPPDVKAGTFWLSKRRPAEWGDNDKPEEDPEEDKIHEELGKMTLDQLRDLLAKKK